MLNRTNTTQVSTIFDNQMIQNISNLSKNISKIASQLPVESNNNNYNDKYYETQIERINTLIQQIKKNTQMKNTENINRQNQMQMVILKLRQFKDWYDSKQFSDPRAPILDLLKYISILVYKQQFPLNKLCQNIKQHKGQQFITIAHQFNYQDFLESKFKQSKFSRLTKPPDNLDKRLIPLIQWYNYFMNIYENHAILKQNQQEIEKKEIEIRKKKIERQQMKLRKMINNNGNIQESKKRLTEISVTISKISSKIQERSKINY